MTRFRITYCPQTYALSVTYGDWGKIQEYGLQQTDLASNTTTSQTRTYSYGSLNEGQTTFAPNNISYADGTNVNEQYGIGGSLQRRETNIPGNQPNEELYRFGTDGNLRLYSYDRLFYSLYGYDGGTTRTYKYSFDLNPNWVNGRLESVNFNLHNAMFYPNAYINFNNNGYYTKHYYNGMERIASRLGDNNLSLATHDPELQDRKWQLDSNIRRNIVDITGYEFLPVGEEQDPDDPKPIYELPVIGISNLLPSADGIYYYHPNHLGSTCYVTDENAIVQQGFLYAPFGEITNEHNSSFGNGVIPKYSFNAKELDEETGMYYYEARYMAPPVFISRDPLFEKYPTFTPYAYCANNPVKYVDPDGKAVIPTNNLKSNASVYAFFSIAENNSVFRNVMKRYYSNQKTVYIHLSQLMKDGVPSGRHNIARTEPAGLKLNPVGKYGIERIIINSDILDKSGKIAGDWTFIFNSLLHEGLHAKMFDTRQSDRGYSNHPGYRDFIIDRPEDGGHHNQMGVFNRQVLIDGMKEFDSQMGTSHSDEWYEAVSWTGLHDTTAWREFEKKNPETAKKYVKIQLQEIRKLGEN